MRKLIIICALVLFGGIGFSQGDSTYLTSFYNKITYPDSLQNKKIEGMVYLEFWIEKDGTITSRKIIKSAHPTLSEIVIKASRFIPPFKFDLPPEKYVRMKIILPINFTLDQ